MGIFFKGNGNARNKKGFRDEVVGFCGFWRGYSC